MYFLEIAREGQVSKQNEASEQGGAQMRATSGTYRLQRMDEEVKTPSEIKWWRGDTDESVE